MKSPRMVLTCALITTLSVSTAVAQSTVQQPASVDAASFDFGTYFAQQNADTPAPDAAATAPAASCDAAADCGCQPDCECEKCRHRLICDHCPLECEDCEPWRLFPCGCGPCERLSVTGWLDAGATTVDGDPPSNFNGPMTFNDRDWGQLNQMYLVTERALENDGCGFDWGGRIDLLYGTDSRFTMARGLETTGAFGPKWNPGGSNDYGLALPQAYLEVGYNDFTIKAGHYYTICGYEVVTAINNFFYSHAYTMQYGEPFTHTGVLAGYQWNDKLQLLGGIDRGWDNWEDDNSNDSFLGGILWDSGEGTTLGVTGTLGKEFTINGDNTQRSLISFVGTREITSRWMYVIQSDIGHQNSGNPSDPGEPAEWYGINQYLFYKINCCWTAGLRAEWFRDDDGVRVTGLQPNNPITGSYWTGDFAELSLGLNWKPNANLMVRPEVRYDTFDGASRTGLALPYDDGTDSKMFSAALDVILVY